MNQNTAQIVQWLSRATALALMEDCIEIMVDEKTYEYNNAKEAYDDLMGANEFHALWFACICRQTFGSVRDAPPSVKILAARVFQSRDPGRAGWLRSIQQTAILRRRG